MSYQFLLKLLSPIILILSANLSYAVDNHSGIWLGSLAVVSIPEEENNLDKMYFSIHQTENQVVLVMLSSTEKNGNLFSSTYIGKDLNELSSYASDAFFPDYDPVNQSIKYIDNVFQLRIDLNEDGKSGLIYRLSDTANFPTLIKIEKIL